MGRYTGIVQKMPLLLITLSLLASQSVVAGDLERAQAKRIHDRLTGSSASNATIDAMESLLLSDSNGKSAADYAIDNSNNPAGARGFYNVTLKNFAAPWTNEEQTVFTPLNDYTATVIGMVRDGIDFRQVLSGDILYRGNGNLGISNYSNSNNDHYEELEALGPTTGNLASPSVLQGPSEGVIQSSVTGLTPNATAGIMTSRTASMAFFSDGTNRAMFRFTLMNHMCTDLEPLKDTSRTPDRIRQDVSRSPGGDSRIFLNACVGCHAGMDGMAGAFANYEWDYTNDKSDGSLVYTPGVVSEKHLINPTNFEHGYITQDDSWVNYWRNGPNSLLANRPGDTSSGWSHGGETLDTKGNAIGSGAKSLGVELSNSKAFAQCQVNKVFKSVCLRDPEVFAADRTARDGFVTNFTGSGYDMREVFTDVAAHCKGS